MRDVDNMLAIMHNNSLPKRPKSYSDRATGYWVETQTPINDGFYSRSVSTTSTSSTSSQTSSPSLMSRVVNVFGVGKMFDEHGYYNSSRQVMK